MTRAETTRQGIRQAVAADLGAVRPLLSPDTRTFMLVPLAVFVAAAAFGRYGRKDLHHLGLTIAWGLSAAQWLTGVTVLRVAFQEAIPGASLPPRRLWLSAGAIVGLLLATTWLTYAAHPTHIPDGHAAAISFLCLVGSLKVGLTLVATATLLAARAVPTMPGRVGALCGLAAGVVADSGWRLTCWVTAPAHVVTTHLLAVVAMIGCGTMLATLWDRIGRLRRTRGLCRRQRGC